MIRLFARLLPAFIALPVLSQSPAISEIERVYFDTSKHDTVRADAAIQLADNVYTTSLDSAYRLIRKADEWSEKHAFNRGLSITSGYLGFIFHTQGDYLRGIEAYQKSIAFNRKHNFDQNLAMDLGNYGVLLSDLKDSKAVDHFKESIDIYKKANSHEDVAYIYSYVGDYFNGNDQVDTAIYYYKKGLWYSSTNGTKAMLKRHLAEAYFSKKNESEAYSLVNDAYNLVNKDRDQSGLKLILITKLELCLATNRFEEAQVCIEELETIEDVETNRNAIILYEQLKSHVLYRSGEYKSAYELLESVYEKRNELYNDELVHLIKRKSIEFEFQEKNKKDSIRLREEKALSDLKYESKLAKEANRRYILWGSVISLLLITGLIARSYVKNKRSTKIIESQNSSLESKNKKIIDSINYARRIQTLILPSSNQLKSVFPESFVYNQPKDILGGDFYWLFEKGDIRLLAVADCTGHGVPGALLSVICSEALNRAVGEFDLIDPASILNKVRDLIKDHLMDSNEKLTDGMDISLISLKQVETVTQLTFSGANSSILIRSNDQINVLNGDRQPIGKYFNESSFTNIQVELNKGDLIFLTTDGYYDQFGGPNSKKMKLSSFVSFLDSIKGNSVSQYESEIITYFENWKGNEEQLDDVCFVGIQLQ